MKRDYMLRGKINRASRMVNKTLPIIHTGVWVEETGEVGHGVIDKLKSRNNNHTIITYNK